MSSTTVTVDNFVRAETDNYFAGLVAAAGIGVFRHVRAPMSIDAQTVVRTNRDTLYSSAVFDLDAGAVTIELPDAGRRFMSMQVISEDHFTPLVAYDPGPHVISTDIADTRYVCVLIRTLVDPDDPADVAEVHRLQDMITVTQADRGEFVIPDWDQTTLTIVRDTLKRVAPSIDHRGERFGPHGDVDPIGHLVGTAIGWGGNPSSDATYLGGFPEHNDGTVLHTLTVGDVPVDGFWSISVYNADGFFEANDEDRYSVNNLTADPNPDGTITVVFGRPPHLGANHLPTPAGWNYVVRLYRPRPEILDGSWSFPKPSPAQPTDSM